MHAYGLGIKEDRQAAKMILTSLHDTSTSTVAALMDSIDEDDFETLIDTSRTQLCSLLSSLAGYDDGSRIWDRLAQHNFDIRTLLTQADVLCQEYATTQETMSAYPQIHTQRFVTEDVILLEV